MKNLNLTLAGAAVFATLALLQGCVPAVIANGATVGAMSAHDRRSTGVQTDDETNEWKAAQAVPEKYAAASHLTYCENDIIGRNCNMLASRAFKELNELFDLRFFLTLCGLVDRKLDASLI